MFAEDKEIDQQLFSLGALSREGTEKFLDWVRRTPHADEAAIDLLMERASNLSIGPLRTSSTGVFRTSVGLDTFLDLASMLRFIRKTTCHSDRLFFDTLDGAE
jgi:hypothetical protein